MLEGMAMAYELRSEFAMAIRTFKEAAKGSAADVEVDRLMASVKRCRRKRRAFFLRFFDQQLILFF
jgi:hypothetical protein